jgi:glucuronate isomerase
MSVKTEILKNLKAELIFDAIKELPIIDYHCHLSPSEIYEDREFHGISRIFLSADHYKWRLMRAFGTDEKYITGDAPDNEKFAAYIAAVEGAYGNPLRDFTRLELSEYFGIDLPLNSQNAEKIRKAADAVIRKKSLSPRKLIEASRVEYIATTDDPADSLFFHERIRQIRDFSTVVVPTFRADRLFDIRASDFAAYLERLAAVCGSQIESFEDFLKAVDKRIGDFKAAGCSFADIGIEDFPSAQFITREKNADKSGKFQSGESFGLAKKAFSTAKNGAERTDKSGKFQSGESFGLAKKAFSTAKNGAERTDKNGKFQSGESFGLAKKAFSTAKNDADRTEYYNYLGFMFPFLLSKCREYGLTAQLHLGVLRNTNEGAFSVLGADKGFDAVADGFSVDGLRAVLNAADGAGGLPKIILYTLNPAYYYPLITLAGSFRGVFVGAPWWFNDHKYGMLEYFSRVSELSHIGKIPGMLTDSRSFLSYARHDYFRMVLAEYLSRFDDGTDDGESLIETAKNIAYFNMKRILNT